MILMLHFFNQALSLIYVSKSAKETIWIAINLVIIFNFYEGLMTKLKMGNNYKGFAATHVPSTFF